MKFLEEFRSTEYVKALLGEIRKEVDEGGSYTFMEVCGTHTVSIARNGLRRLLPPQIRLVSGPGCPVCVTSTEYIDKAIALSERDDVTITTFGDMMRVPGSRSTLESAKARGRDVRVVLSAFDALVAARENPGRKVVFLGIGFETTVPTIAAALRRAHAENAGNFFVFSAHKTMPVPMRILASDPEIGITGYICPGHVCTIAGLGPFLPLAEEFKVAGAIAGFEPVDILRAVLSLVRQRNAGKAYIDNLYSRSVKNEGNTKALAVVEETFEASDDWWRGLGNLPGSGLAIRPEYEAHDAQKAMPVEVPPAREPAGCRCGEVLKGKIVPSECPLFGKACTPENPVGACMVSQEGVCQAAHRWGNIEQAAQS